MEVETLGFPQSSSRLSSLHLHLVFQENYLENAPITSPHWFYRYLFLNVDHLLVKCKNCLKVNRWYIGSIDMNKCELAIHKVSRPNWVTYLNQTSMFE
jgi:hypothetical protein